MHGKQGNILTEPTLTACFLESISTIRKRLRRASSSSQARLRRLSSSSRARLRRLSSFSRAHLSRVSSSCHEHSMEAAQKYKCGKFTRRKGVRVCVGWWESERRTCAEVRARTAREGRDKLTATHELQLDGREDLAVYGPTNKKTMVCEGSTDHGLMKCSLKLQYPLTRHLLASTQAKENEG
jgi:hypothetical protein